MFYASTNLLAADQAHGKKLYQTCVACHGEKGQGNDSLNAPVLAGQKQWYVKRQLQNFVSGIRGKDPKDIYGLMMRPMALGLSGSTDIDDVVAYISTL